MPSRGACLLNETSDCDSRIRPAVFLDLADESIASTRNGLDEPRLVGRVRENVTQPLHGHVQAMLKVDVGPGSPERRSRAKGPKWIVLAAVCITRCSTHSTGV
jgi:hypothetical protein